MILGAAVGCERSKGMKVYISGPITGTDDYAKRFDDAEQKLIDEGHEVVNPAKTNATLPTSTTWEQYMNMCYMMLDMCDAIVMLDGWEKSKGACIEYGYALAKDLIIVKGENANVK